MRPIVWLPVHIADIRPRGRLKEKAFIFPTTSPISRTTPSINGFGIKDLRRGSQEVIIAHYHQTALPEEFCPNPHYFTSSKTTAKAGGSPARLQGG